MSGFAMNSSNRKHPPTTAISAITSASSMRKPLFCKYSTINTSTAVIAMPTGSVIPKSRLRAIAVPITSARSHAAMAISHSTQRPKATGGE